MCGEMVGDPAAIPLLPALGLDDFRMAAGSIPFAKDQIRRLSIKELEPLKDVTLAAASGEEIGQVASFRRAGSAYGAVRSFPCRRPGYIAIPTRVTYILSVFVGNDVYTFAPSILGDE
jgi:hypothetical protein